MAYNTLVPTTGHSASQDYTAIQGNFAQLQTSFSVNHTPLASGGGTEGFHTKVQFPAVIADPGLASPQSSLYIKTVAGASQLFFQNGPLAANVAQLTGFVSTSGNDGAGGSYVVFQTPFGFRIFTGATASAAGSQNLTLSGGVTFGATIYTAQATPFGVSPTPVSFTPAGGTGNFNIQRTGTAPLSWFAITT